MRRMESCGKLKELLAEVERLDREATKGPWKMFDGLKYPTKAYPRHAVVARFGTDDGKAVLNRGGQGNDVVANIEDWDFIAHSRMLLPGLAHCLKRAMEALEYAENHFRDVCPDRYNAEGVVALANLRIRIQKIEEPPEQ